MAVGAEAYGHRFVKVVVLGPYRAGKTCLVGRHVNGEAHNMNTRSTTGVNLNVKEVQDRGEHTLHLQIYDLAGQERFGLMTRVYYKDTAGAVVVIEGKGQKGPSPLDEARKWKEDIDNKACLSDSSRVPCILVVNKNDLPGAPLNTDEELAEFSGQQGFVGWVRTSARTNTNVDRAFDTLIDAILDNAREGRVSTEAKNTFNLALPTDEKKKKKGFC